jgi:hypothetical protein
LERNRKPQVHFHIRASSSVYTMSLPRDLAGDWTIVLKYGSV